MVSTLDFGCVGQGFKPWHGTLCCALGQDILLLRHFALTIPVNKWVQAFYAARENSQID